MIKTGMIVRDAFQKPQKDIGRVVRASAAEVEVRWRQPTAKQASMTRKAANVLLVEAEGTFCELCLDETKDRTGCAQCAALVCDECLAAQDDPTDDEICESCS